MDHYVQIKVEPMDTDTNPAIGIPYAYPATAPPDLVPRTVTFAPKTGGTGLINTTTVSSALLFPEEIKVETPSPLPASTPTTTIPQFSVPLFSTPPLTPTLLRQYGDSSPADVSGFSFSDFLVQLEDYAPTLPDSVANHFLQLGGFESSDPRMSRLISIAAQKYISDVINDAFTHCKLKGQVPVGKAKVKDKKYVLTMEDLIPVLNDYAITVKKPPYYV